MLSMLFACLLWSGAPASATRGEAAHGEDASALVRSASLIVEGTVVGHWWDPMFPKTEMVAIQPMRMLKGAVAGDAVVLRWCGARRPDGLVALFDGGGTFLRAGDEVLIFAGQDAHPDGGAHRVALIDCVDGVYKKTSAGGRAVAVNGGGAAVSYMLAGVPIGRVPKSSATDDLPERDGWPAFPDAILEQALSWDDLLLFARTHADGDELTVPGASLGSIPPAHGGDRVNPR